MRILIKFPTRSRPNKFFETLERYLATASGKHDIRVLVSCDIDDVSMFNMAVQRQFATMPQVSVHYGRSKSKVQAINADMEHAGEYDVLLLASDDMLPKEHGYDDIICEEMTRHFPDLDGVLHFNDGRVGRKLNTLCILGRPYYERFGYIYHPAYTSLWCDNEFQAVSEGLGKAAYIDRVIIHHAWIDHVGQDPLMRRNNAFYKRDERVFKYRMANGFPVKTPPIPTAPAPLRWRPLLRRTTKARR